MLYLAEVGTHPSPHLLCIVEKVDAVLVVHPRDAIQEAALQTQGYGGAGGLFDGVACSRDVDALDGFAIQLAAVGVVAEIGDQPAAVSVTMSRGSSLQTGTSNAPHRCDTILGAREN